MVKIRRVLRCYNCGSVLQSEKKTRPGYLEKELIDTLGAEGHVLYCHNCYEKMKAINTGMLETDADEEILKILKDAVATDALIIWVVDLFSFNGTLNPAVVKKVKKLKVAVFGTKYDLFPKRIKQKDICQFVEDRFVEAGIKPVLVRAFGNTEKIIPGELFDILNDLRQGHDVYMIGSLTSGKTSILNRMLKGYINKSKKTVSSEFYPGTSLKVLEVPLTNSSSLYELPGFSLNTSVLGKVEKETKAVLIPKKEIKMQRIILDEDDAMVVGSLGAYILVKGKPTTFHFYGAEKIETRKMKYFKIDNFFRENAIKRSLRPVSERYSMFTDYDVFEYTMEADGKEHDIAITGLGWARFEGRGQIVRVICPKGTAIKETVSKIEK